MNFFLTTKEKILNWLAAHPAISRLTVTKKIITAYTLVAIFSMVAILFALNALHRQTTTSTNLVQTDIRAVSLARALQSNLTSLEKLDRQYLLIPSAETLALIEEKYAKLPGSWDQFTLLLPAEDRSGFSDAFEKYRQQGARHQKLQKGKANTKQLEKSYYDLFLPSQHTLDSLLTDFRDRYQKMIDAALGDLSRESARSFQTTLLLLLLGVFLATPIALSVLLNIHRSLRHLTEATQQISEGNYQVDLETASHDEFGQLAREFQRMGRKLQEFEAFNLDANPLTHLPGNMMIQRRVEDLLAEGIPFAHAFADLDHFKAYNDRYGYQRGSDIIAAVGDVISDVIKDAGNEDDFIGHIGGDDYIFLTSPEKVEELAKMVIERFDSMVPEMYSAEDRESGFFVCQDRFGVERQFPLMTISISIICSDTSNYDSAIAISHECAKMKEHLKRLPGSNYLIDRRRGKS